MELNTDSIWTALAASMRDVPVGAPFTVADVEAALGRREAQIRAALDAWVERRKARSSTSIELQAPAERTRANLAAARLLVRGAPFSPDDQATLALYSGWGGLSIDKIRDQWPSGLPQPEKRGLIHEYYTPLRVWQEVVRVLLPLIPGLHGDDVLRVLEPSVGIGRALEALRLAGVQAQITAAEYSEVSARLVAARFPAARLHKGPFEELATDLYLNPHLVLSNPPYGVRGGSKTADPVREYRRKDDGSDRKAYVYFLRRTLDLLTPGGVGVYLVPSGFMTGTGGQLEVLRRRVLRRHHLLGAFRLPSGLFPGAWLVTDLLFFRSRGGELPGVLDTDEKIALGGYFKAHPAHILGEEKGQEKGEDDQSKKPRWGYEVVGTFTRLPDPDWRPMLGEVAPSTARRRVRQVSATRTASQAVADSASDDVGRAVEIGLRADLVFAGKADGWAEMARDAKAWATHYGNPHKHEDLSLAAQRGQTGALRFLSLFAKNGQPTEALLTAPKKVGGAVKHTDPHLAGLDIYKNNKGILLPSDLAALGFAVDPAALRRLTDQGWCLDPARSSYRLLRPEHYYTGLLWPRLDRLDGHTPPPPLADALKAQRARLMELIDPDPITEIQHSPLDGFVPADLLAKWFGAVLFDKVGFSDADAPNFSRAFGSTLGLHRINAGIVLTVNGEVKPYSFLNDQHPSRKNEKILPQLLRCLFGWINYDRALFTPPRQKEEELDDVRARVASAWMAHWEAWVQADPERADALAVAYNRHFKGRIPIEYGTDEIPLARWSGALTPHSYQRRSIQRLHDRRGGILALDVGLGKTATGIYTLGLARQEGWAQRPVIVVPNTLLFKWKADIERLLTGYRVLVVGAKAKITKDGEDDLVPDSAVERGAKWTEFQSGLWDVVVMPYSMLGASRFNEARLRQYAETCGELALVARAEIEEAERQQKVNEGDRKGKAKPLTERQKAILEEGLYGWIAGKLELAEGREYDAGIAWDDLGIDFLMIDEGQNFKNLFTPKPREGGEVPKYMGASASSARAWQLHVRAWDVRTRNSKDGGDNGAGVVILSATPAKNSPLEFYSLSNFTTPSIWRERGIRNSEEFIERFIALDTKPLIDPSGAVKSRSYVAGFRSLHELRVALAEDTEFRTADEVGLQIPDVEVETIQVELSGAAEDLVNKLKKEYREALANAAFDKQSKITVLKTPTLLSMAAVHPDLVGFGGAEEVDGKKPKLAPGAVLKKAKDHKHFESAKFRACALEVAKRRDCGHVIFVEYIAAHIWLQRTIAKYSAIKPERIALLNAVTAPTPVDRQKIAAAFNSGQYDVVICNAVAYEGIDLQRRTCALHHIDLPYEPATLQQRNGRGVRQGNAYLEGGRNVVKIYYYLAVGSADLWRQQTIIGKRNWMVELVKGQDRETNNPNDPSGDEDELQALLSDDPEGARERLRVIREKSAQIKAAKAAQVWAKTLQGAIQLLQVARIRATTETPEQIEGRLQQAARAFAKAEELQPPGAPITPEHLRAIKAGAPAVVYCHLTRPDSDTAEQLRLAGDLWVPTVTYTIAISGWVLEPLERGGLSPSGRRVAQRRLVGRIDSEGFLDLPHGSIRWLFSRPYGEEIGASALYRLVQAVPEDWDSDEAVENAKRYDDLLKIAHLNHWNSGPDWWIERMWSRRGTQLLDAVKRLRSQRSFLWLKDGRLGITTPERIPEGAGLLPPSNTGWAVFLRDAHTTGLPYSTLTDLAKNWWGRPAPTGLAERSLAAPPVLEVK